MTRSLDGLSPRGRGNPSQESSGQSSSWSIPAWAGKPCWSRCQKAVMRVYPRVGGETLWTRTTGRSKRGLSPRGRGNLRRPMHRRIRARSIPAWAGKPHETMPPECLQGVYPRVGGETHGARREAEPASGLSPRGRGNRLRSFFLFLSKRSIPAWAGKPCRSQVCRRCWRVYPRVGGETCRSTSVGSFPAGLSPRGRGNRIVSVPCLQNSRSIPAWAGKPDNTTIFVWNGGVYPRVGGETRGVVRKPYEGKGLSPRGRGNLARDEQRICRSRSIPAWAGKPRRRPVTDEPTRVYPRVGGETAWTGWLRMRADGLSPRGRGNHLPDDRSALVSRSIPAWAGKPHRSASNSSIQGVYPRVGGETPAEYRWRDPRWGLSPRGRGNPDKAPVMHPAQRSIPAWAGKPREDGQGRRPQLVYPRVGGETGAVTLWGLRVTGLSPRGRGNHRKINPVNRVSGSIPAWAGKPGSWRCG